MNGRGLWKKCEDKWIDSFKQEIKELIKMQMMEQGMRIVAAVLNSSYKDSVIDNMGEISGMDGREKEE